MARIENRFLELLAEKRRLERKSWTYRDIYAETGITPSALSKLAQQANSGYDGYTLARLCVFLGCSLGDLLVLVHEDPEPGQLLAVAVA